MIPRRDREAGLTLIEVMVVLAVIGVMAGVAMLGLGALDRGARAEAEALRLAGRLQLAGDAALVSSAPHALVWDAQGYGFARWDAAAQVWRPSDLRLLERHTLPAAFRLARQGAPGGASALIGADIAQPTIVLLITGGAAPWSVAFDGISARAAPLEPRDG